MDQDAQQIDWEPILWGAGIVITLFFSIIGGLLGWIGGLIKQDRATFISVQNADREEFRQVQNRNSEWMMTQQREIKDLSESTKIAIEHNTTAIEFVKELVMKRR